MDAIDSLFTSAFSSMIISYERKEFRLAATYGQLAAQYLWLLEELSYVEKEGEKSEENNYTFG